MPDCAKLFTCRRSWPSNTIQWSRSSRNGCGLTANVKVSSLAQRCVNCSTSPSVCSNTKSLSIQRMPNLDVKTLSTSPVCNARRSKAAASRTHSQDLADLDASARCSFRAAVGAAAIEVHQDFAGFGAVRWADDAAVFKFIHHARGAAVAQAQAALQERNARFLF